MFVELARGASICKLCLHSFLKMVSASGMLSASQCAISVDSGLVFVIISIPYSAWPGPGFLKTNRDPASLLKRVTGIVF